MLTVDIDRRDIDIKGTCENIKRYLRAKYPNNIIDMKYRLSCSKGYHIKVLGVPNDYFDRWIFGDDVQRINIDQIRERQGLPINVLFDKKVLPNGKTLRAGKWFEV